MTPCWDMSLQHAHRHLQDDNVNLQFAPIENAAKFAENRPRRRPFFFRIEVPPERRLNGEPFWKEVDGGASHPPSTSSYPPISNMFEAPPAICETQHPVKVLFKWWPPSADRTHSSKSPKSCAASHNTLAAGGREKKKTRPRNPWALCILRPLHEEKNLVGNRDLIHLHQNLIQKIPHLDAEPRYLQMKAMRSLCSPPPIENGRLSPLPFHLWMKHCEISGPPINFWTNLNAFRCSIQTIQEDVLGFVACKALPYDHHSRVAGRLLVCSAQKKLPLHAACSSGERHTPCFCRRCPANSMELPQIDQLFEHRTAKWWVLEVVDTGRDLQPELTFHLHRNIGTPNLFHTSMPKKKRGQFEFISSCMLMYTSMLWHVFQLTIQV